MLKQLILDNSRWKLKHFWTTKKVSSSFNARFLIFAFFWFPGSESPANFMELKGRHTDAERYRQMAKLLIGNEDKKLSNEISAPYEVPQYPIEQIETKLIRLVA